MKKPLTSKTLLHIAAFAVLFLAGDFLSSIPFDCIFQFIELPQRWMYASFRVTGCIVFTFFLFRLYTKKALGLQMRDFRITFDIKARDVLYAFLLPAFVILSLILIGKPSFNQNLTADNATGIILSALFRALKAGILEEILFRGYVMTLLENRWNKRIAIIVPSFLFSLAHIPSMESFHLSSILLLVISGTAVGVMFSLAAQRSNSICGSAVIHILWNFIMTTDILHVFHGNASSDTSIFSIALPSGNALLTGAGFGIEASVFSIAGYIMIIALVLFGLKRNPAKERTQNNF